TARVNGPGGRLSQTQPEPTGRRAPDLSLPLGRAANQRSGPGLVQRHHLRADGLRVHVSGGGDGLVEPLCAGLGTIQQPGQRGLGRWFGQYNTERPHQALGYATPADVYHSPDSYGAKQAAWRWK